MNHPIEGVIAALLGLPLKVMSTSARKWGW